MEYHFTEKDTLKMKFKPGLRLGGYNSVTKCTVVPCNSGLQNSGLPLSSGQFLGDQLFYVVIPP